MPLFRPGVGKIDKDPIHCLVLYIMMGKCERLSTNDKEVGKGAIDPFSDNLAHPLKISLDRDPIDLWVVLCFFNNPRPIARAVFDGDRVAISKDLFVFKGGEIEEMVLLIVVGHEKDSLANERAALLGIGTRYTIVEKANTSSG